MNPTRSFSLLGLSLFATAGLALAAPPSVQDEHLLGRIGYGHDNWTRNRLAALGKVAFVDEQLDPGSIADPELSGILNTDPQLDAWKMTLQEIAATFKSGPNAVRKVGELGRQARYEHFLRGALSRRQLQALLVEFWFNHFNVDLQNGGDAHLLIPYLRSTLRPRVLGKFEDLLLAVARSPAMLEYLDNAKNFKNGYVVGGQTVGLNENYARELMELHTFGIDDQGGVYSQKDVIEVARCLTGWTYDRNVGFKFVAAGHDQGAKSPLGLKIAANGGEQDGITILRHLARHPRVATVMCRKLVTFFAGPGQPDLVTRARDKWIATGGDIKAVMRVILLSPELRDAADVKVKRPNLLIISALRAIDVDVSDMAARQQGFTAASNLCSTLGLTVYQVPPPTGWADAPGTFLSEGAMLERFRSLNRLFGTKAPLFKGFNGNSADNAVLLDRMGDRILGTGGMTAQSRTALGQYLSTLPASLTAEQKAWHLTSLIVSGPEFANY